MNQLKQTSSVFLVTFALVCLGLVPRLQAVNPVPDGCYGNYATAEGCKALQFLSSGAGNSGLGWYALYSDTTGNFNTGVGAGALALNNGDSNTAVGTAALLLNTSGTGNTAVGTDALVNNDSGNYNTATGSNALSSNTTGHDNTATGIGALENNTMGIDNTATGADALNINTTGYQNTATGFSALGSNTAGTDNMADGFDALYSNTTGGYNTATGDQALYNNTTGSYNVALGFIAGHNATSGSNNIYIGAGMTGVAGESSACYIGSIFGQTSASGAPVYINSAGKLGTGTSSRRFKDDIKPMDGVSKALFSLKPVVFRYKKEIDPVGTPQLGLVAEDVQKVNPDLVVRDKEGKPYSVRYDQVNAMLLNEFLKEHREVRELKKQVAALAAGLQKVSAQLATASPAGGGLQLSKSIARAVVNNH
jgi:hypothetical protein